MKKSTKALLASIAGAVLLIGGGTTLAWWSSQGTVEGGTITTGELKLVPDEGSCTDWFYVEDGEPSVTEFDPATSRLVPGDSITRECTFTINAEGDNLLAELSWDTPSLDADQTADVLQTVLDFDVAFSINDAPAAAAPIEITSDNDGDTVTAVFTLEFPFGEAADNTTNVSEGLAAVLEDLSVTLTQIPVTEP